MHIAYTPTETRRRAAAQVQALCRDVDEAAPPPVTEAPRVPA